MKTMNTKKHRVKSAIAGILASITICTAVTPAFASAAVLEAQPSAEFHVTEDSERYLGHAIVNGFYHNDNGNVNFKYSDGIFEEDPFVYSNHMATMSSYLVHASCTYTFTKDGKKSYEQGGRDVADILTQAGFENICVSDSYTVKPGTDSVGCVIATKTVHTKRGDRKIISVTVRSGGYEKEWASNVTLGKSGEAQGFSEAADQVVKYVNEYLEKYGDKEVMDGNASFWVQGFSRGGATANLTAKRLIDAYQTKGDEIYAYCLEAPQGGVASAERADRNYRCIHNVINEDDLVPYVAPTAMGFKRYGIDHYLQRGAAQNGNPVKSTSFTNNLCDNLNSPLDLNMQLKRMKKQLEIMIPDASKRNDYMPYDITKYKLDLIPSFEFVSKGKTNEASFYNKFLENLIANGSSNPITRDKYAKLIEAPLRRLMEYCNDDNDLKALIGTIDMKDFGTDVGLACLSDLLKDTKADGVPAWAKLGALSINPLHILEYFGEQKITFNLSDDTREHLSSAIAEELIQNEKFMRKLGRYPNANPGKLAPAGQAVSDIRCIFKNVLNSVKDLDDILTLCLNLNGILKNHTFQQCIAWLRSFDDWYDAYDSVEFVTEKKLQTMPLSVKLDIVNTNSKYLNDANVRIYGNCVSGVDKHGKYIIEEKLLRTVTATSDVRSEITLPDNVLPESVCFVIEAYDQVHGRYYDPYRVPLAELMPSNKVSGDQIKNVHFVIIGDDQEKKTAIGINVTLKNGMSFSETIH